MAVPEKLFDDDSWWNDALKGIEFPSPLGDKNHMSFADRFALQDSLTQQMVDRGELPRGIPVSIIDLGAIQIEPVDNLDILLKSLQQATLSLDSENKKQAEDIKLLTNTVRLQNSNMQVLIAQIKKQNKEIQKLKGKK